MAQGAYGKGDEGRERINLIKYIKGEDELWNRLLFMK
jgi:hypothetical protein